jgi:AcrR family transcriptional regulator
MTSRRTPSRPGRPRGPRRDRDERRAELLDAAERAIRRVGASASMDEIAAEAGVTKPILYSHFGDKEGLVSALTARVAGRLNATIGSALTQAGEPRQVVASTIEAFCTFIEGETELYRFLVQSAKLGRHGSGPRLMSDIASQIAVTLGGGLRRAGADSGAAEPWAYAMVGMTFAGAGWWLERRSMSKDDLVGYLTQLLWSGLSGAGLDRIEPWDSGELAPAPPTPAAAPPAAPTRASAKAAERPHIQAVPSPRAAGD